MQPETPPKPVMDVTVPAQPAGTPAAPVASTPAIATAPNIVPSTATPLAPATPPAQPQALAVHEPPKLSGDEPSPAFAVNSAVHMQPQPSVNKPQKLVPLAKPHDPTPPLPVGAIVMTLLTMAILAGAAVVMYLKS